MRTGCESWSQSCGRIGIRPPCERAVLASQRARRFTWPALMTGPPHQLGLPAPDRRLAALLAQHAEHGRAGGGPPLAAGEPGNVTLDGQRRAGHGRYGLRRPPSRPDIGRGDRRPVAAGDAGRRSDDLPAAARATGELVRARPDRRGSSAGAVPRGRHGHSRRRADARAPGPWRRGLPAHEPRRRSAAGACGRRSRSATLRVRLQHRGHGGACCRHGGRDHGLPAHQPLRGGEAPGRGGSAGARRRLRDSRS